jgi:hypothetical protein
MQKTIVSAAMVLLFSFGASSQATWVELEVKGRVVDELNQPVAGAKVTVSPIGPLKGVLPMGTSDERGEFSVVVHQTGEFLVSAQKTTDGYASTSNPFYYPNTTTTGRLMVVADQPPPPATVRFGSKGGKLALHIIDADNNLAIPYLTISLCRVEAPKYCHRFASGAVRGIHSVLVPSVPFTIEVNAAGYEDAYGDGPSEVGMRALQVPAGVPTELTVAMHRSNGKESPKLPAPKVVSPADGAVFMNTPHPRKLALEWANVPGAATYTVEVELCDQEVPGGKCRNTSPLLGWRWPPPSGLEVTRYELIFPGTQPGRWRAWAVDAKGHPGEKTPWTYFFYRWDETLPF